MSENIINGGDERLKKSSGPATRADRSAADQEREGKDGTVMSVEERRRLMRSEWAQEVLPTPPSIPGWHFCWLSTTNSSDPIYKRIQKGYEPVKAPEIPGFMQFRVDQGEFEGCVACNEMLLFKIPEELYQDVMSYFHHELPHNEEEMLRANAEKVVSGSDSNGRELGEVEGFSSLGRKARIPTF